MIDYETALGHTDWKSITDDKKEGLQIMQRTTHNGFRAMKAMGTVNHNSQLIFKVLGNSDYRPSYDGTFDSGRYL